jgi:hypothetical protein
MGGDVGKQGAAGLEGFKAALEADNVNYGYIRVDKGQGTMMQVSVCRRRCCENGVLWCCENGVL